MHPIHIIRLFIQNKYEFIFILTSQLICFHILFLPRYVKYIYLFSQVLNAVFHFTVLIFKLFLIEFSLVNQVFQFFDHQFAGHLLFYILWSVKFTIDIIIKNLIFIYQFLQMFDVFLVLVFMNDHGLARLWLVFLQLIFQNGDSLVGLCNTFFDIIHFFRYGQIIGILTILVH